MANNKGRPPKAGNLKVLKRNALELNDLQGTELIKKYKALLRDNSIVQIPSEEFDALEGDADRVLKSYAKIIALTHKKPLFKIMLGKAKKGEDRWLGFFADIIISASGQGKITKPARGRKKPELRVTANQEEFLKLLEDHESNTDVQ